MRLFLACALTLAPLAALAQDLVFSPQATELCLDSVAPIAQAQCVGHSADACMQDTVGGESTVGMGGCLWAEYEYWDARLNAAYTALRALNLATDEANATLTPQAPSLADSLQAMQRAWIPYRDATCDYARAQWGGGTGGGPATSACLLDLTGRQALTSEFHLAEAQR